MLADSAVEIEQVKWLVLNAAWKADQGGDARHEASIAKLAGAGMIWRGVDRVMQIHGGVGFTKKKPLQRGNRDVLGHPVHQGNHENPPRAPTRHHPPRDPAPPRGGAPQCPPRL